MLCIHACPVQLVLKIQEWVRKERSCLQMIGRLCVFSHRLILAAYKLAVE